MCSSIVTVQSSHACAPRLPLLLQPHDHIMISLTKSPMQTLPNELLCYIFYSATHDSSDRRDSMIPFVVSHVCRRWRSVSLSTGNLWTSIILSFPMSLSRLYRATIWLARSKHYPLDILMDFRDPSWDWDEDTHAFRWQWMETIMRFLLPHAGRWWRLELYTDTWAPIFAFLWYTRRVASVPMLESITLSRCNAYFAGAGHVFEPVALKQPVPLFGGLPLDKLREVCLSGVHVDWSNTGLRNLTSLEFKYHASDVLPSLAQFIDLLTASPNLEHLTILGWGPQIDNTSDVAISSDEDDHFMSLRRVQRSILLPRLTRFFLGFVDVDYVIQLLSLFCCPAVEELSFEDISASFNPYDYQDATPLLECMVSNHVSRCSSPSHSSTCCTTASFPLSQVHTLELQRVHSTRTSFSRFLNEFTSLKDLSLVDVRNDVLQALQPQSPTSPATDNLPYLPCPALSHLTCRRVDPNAVMETVNCRAAHPSILPLEKVYLDIRDIGGGNLSDETLAPFYHDNVILLEYL